MKIHVRCPMHPYKSTCNAMQSHVLSTSLQVSKTPVNKPLQPRLHRYESALAKTEFLIKDVIGYRRTLPGHVISKVE